MMSYGGWDYGYGYNMWDQAYMGTPAYAPMAALQREVMKPTSTVSTGSGSECLDDSDLECHDVRDCLMSGLLDEIHQGSQEECSSVDGSSRMPCLNPVKVALPSSWSDASHERALF